MENRQTAGSDTTDAGASADSSVTSDSAAAGSTGAVTILRAVSPGAEPRNALASVDGRTRAIIKACS